MAYIKEKYFHIKGTPKEDEVFSTVTNNYVHAVLGYDKGKGYYWRISRSGKYTLRSNEYGDSVMCCFRLSDPSPSLYELLVPCGRRGKAKEREAVELFDNNVVSAITDRLGYDIEEE